MGWDGRGWKRREGEEMSDKQRGEEGHTEDNGGRPSITEDMIDVRPMTEGDNTTDT